MLIIKKLWRFTGRYKWLLLAGVLFTILNVVTSMIPGYINRKIIDDVIVGSDTGILPGLLVSLFIVYIFRSLSVFFERYFLERFSQDTLRDMKQGVYDHLQKLSFNYFNNTRTGELMSRMTGDMEAIRNLMANGTVQLTKIVFYLLLTGLVLFRLNWKLTLISLATSPFIVFFAYRLSGTIKPAFRRVRKQFSRLNSTVQENITGIRIVKAFHQQTFEMEKFDEENNRFFWRNYKVARIWARYFPALEFLGGVSTVFLLFFGGRLVIEGEITLGIWWQFNSYLWMLLMPMRLLGNVVNMINNAIASGERIFNILEEEPEITNSNNTKNIKEIKGEVEFKNVSLQFDNQHVLKDINLNARPGSTIAIMGATGSGKTSLINLIGRYYDPTKGEVFIDGINIKEIDLHTLRSNVATVMQETFLFSETLEQNIAYGIPDFNQEQMEEAASIAGAREFIKGTDEGYETVVGERGMGLSGGQKQRISLARAIIMKAPILILDDATSAVDMETEHKIQESLKKIDSTVFIIAHRISSVRNADEIIFLEDGKIIERGTHDELIAKKGEYYKIYKEQYKEIIEDEHFQSEMVMG